MHIELTQDEASQIRYALNELANRRHEQAIEATRPEVHNACRDETHQLRALAGRFEPPPPQH